MANYNSCRSIEIASFDATCDESRASIKRVLVCPKEDVVYIGKTYYSQPDPLTFVEHTNINTILINGKFVEYKFRHNTGSYTSTYTGDITTGSQVVTTEVSLQFSKAEYQKRLEFQKLTGHPCVMIIEDNYGQYLLLGYNSPVVLTNTVMQSGTAKSDLSGFTLTFTEESNQFPPFIETSIDKSNEAVIIDQLLIGMVKKNIKLSESSWIVENPEVNTVRDNGRELIFTPGEADHTIGSYVYNDEGYMPINTYEFNNNIVRYNKAYAGCSKGASNIGFLDTTSVFGVTLSISSSIEPLGWEVSCQTTLTDSDYLINEIEINYFVSAAE